MFRLWCLLLVLAPVLGARPFMVVVYNVENLFDADGSALFEDYQPARYSRAHVLTKLQNITRTLALFEKGRGPDIILLQELEVDLSDGAALPDYADILRRHAHHRITDMLGEAFTPAIADLPGEALLLKALHDAGLTGYTVVRPDNIKPPDSRGPLAQRCVVLTRFPVKHSRVYPTPDARPIHEVLVEVEGAALYLFNNHWKSGASNPETEAARIANARTLRTRLDEILQADPNADIIIGGDLNSQYNQKQRYPRMKETGINDVLGSQGNELAVRGPTRDLYNLWFELPPDERGSDVFRGEWGTLMHLIVSRGLYDYRGVQYVDNSFGVAKVRGLNMDDTGLPIRWSFDGPAGSGFSDHFPVYAKFTVVRDNRPDRYLALRDASVESMPSTHSVDYAKVDLPKVALDPALLPSGAALRDGTHTGRIFRIEGPVGKGRRLTVEVRGDLYDVWSFDQELRERLRKEHKAGETIRFYGELGQYRGRWQFIIRDASWAK